MIEVTLTDEMDRTQVLRDCRLALLNAGGEDGDWWEIVSEIESGRDYRQVVSDYFTFA